MKAIFLSDLHLKRRSDPGYQKCMQLFACIRGRGVESGLSGDANTIVIDLLVIAVMAGLGMASKGFVYSFVQVFTLPLGVPAGTIAAFATTVPDRSLSVDINGWPSPVGHCTAAMGT